MIEQENQEPDTRTPEQKWDATVILAGNALARAAAAAADERAFYGEVLVQLAARPSTSPDATKLFEQVTRGIVESVKKTNETNQRLTLALTKLLEEAKEVRRDVIDAGRQYPGSAISNAESGAAAMIGLIERTLRGEEPIL